jgi:hypothetical protein
MAQQLQARCATTLQADGRNGAGACLCACVVQSDLFYAGIEGLSVTFTHQIDVDYPTSWLGLGVGKERTTIRGSKIEDDVLTVVHDDQGEVYKILEPGAFGVKLRMSELFQLSGVSLEDQLSAESDPNVLYDGQNDVLPGPTLRLTGMQVAVEVDYYNPLSRQHTVFNPRPEHEGPVAVVHLHAKPMWTSLPAPPDEVVELSKDQSGTYRHRYTYGVQITFRRGGHFCFFDTVALMAVFAVALVYLHLPNRAISLIARFALGPLSTIYKRAIRTPVKTDHILAGQVMRAIMRSKELKVMTRKHPEGISAHELRARIDMSCEGRAMEGHIFKDMDPFEREMMKRTIWRVRGRDEDEVLTSSDVLELLSNHEFVALSEVTKYANRTRRIGLLERLLDGSEYCKFTKDNFRQHKLFGTVDWRSMSGMGLSMEFEKSQRVTEYGSRIELAALDSKAALDSTVTEQASKDSAVTEQAAHDDSSETSNREIELADADGRYMKGRLILV